MEKDIETLRGKELLKLTTAKRELQLQRGINYWREKGFPYVRLTAEEINREYIKLEKSKSEDIIRGKMIGFSSVGLSLANSFHPQMWHLTSQGHHQSPWDHFNNDETLKKLLERAARFWPNRQCWRAYCVRNLLRIYSGGRVSNFRPTAAKALIDRYSADGDAVLDFCSGFGGRMLGAVCLKRNYVGIDASKKQILGSKGLFNGIKKQCEGEANLFHGRAEDLMPAMESKNFNLIITSPPYLTCPQMLCQ